VYARPEQVSERGVEGAVPLVVEIRSPGDETDLKLPWYAGLGVAEVLVIDPATRSAEVHVLRSGRLVPAVATGAGLEVLAVGARLRVRAGPTLLVEWEGGAVNL
jgi:Uma2 family endonuclease